MSSLKFDRVFSQATGQQRGRIVESARVPGTYLLKLDTPTNFMLDDVLKANYLPEIQRAMSKLFSDYVDGLATPVPKEHLE